MIKFLSKSFFLAVLLFSQNCQAHCRFPDWFFTPRVIAVGGGVLCSGIIIKSCFDAVVDKDVDYDDPKAKNPFVKRASTFFASAVGVVTSVFLWKSLKTIESLNGEVGSLKEKLRKSRSELRDAQTTCSLCSPKNQSQGGGGGSASDTSSDASSADVYPNLSHLSSMRTSEGLGGRVGGGESSYDERGGDNGGLLGGNSHKSGANLASDGEGIYVLLENGKRLRLQNRYDGDEWNSLNKNAREIVKFYQRLARNILKNNGAFNRDMSRGLEKTVNWIRRGNHKILQEVIDRDSHFLVSNVGLLAKTFFER